MSGKKQRKNNVTVLVGPTSSGKTMLALQLCRKTGGQIISADSRQVYKYADVGTGKAPINTKVEIIKGGDCWVVDGVKIWGYDLISPEKEFSVVDFYNFAREKIDVLIKAEIPTVLVGGTGFYIDVICGRIKIDSGASSPEVRESLSKLPLDELLKQLKNLNPKVYKEIDMKNRQRVARAVEKEMIGHPKDRVNLIAPDFKFKTFGLCTERKILYKKVDQWVDSVWKNGLIEETRFLSDKFSEAKILQGVVYKTTVQFLANVVTEVEAVQRIKWDLHAYIRRQMTWFKRDPSIVWLNIGTNTSLGTTQKCIMEIQKDLNNG